MAHESWDSKTNTVIYKDSIYYILEDLINEICYLPINRYYQNNISLVISCATNHLNTKIGYENGN